MRNMQTNPAFNHNNAGAQTMQPGSLPAMNFSQQGRGPTPGPQQFQAQQDLQKQQYLAKLQAAQQQLHTQTRQQEGFLESPSNNWSSKQNGQPLVRPPMSNAQSQEARANEQNFTSSFTKWALQHNITLDRDPAICGRPITYFQLFIALTKTGVLLPGQNKGKWNMIPSCLGFPEVTYPSAAEEARQLVERNLAAYYMAWVGLMNKRKDQHQQQRQSQAIDTAGASLQTSPTQPVQPPGPFPDSKPLAPSQFSAQNAQDSGNVRGQRALSQSNISMLDGHGSSASAQPPSNASATQQTALDRGRPSSTQFPGPSPGHLEQFPTMRASSGLSVGRFESYNKSGFEKTDSAVKPGPDLEGTEYTPGCFVPQTYGGYDLPKVAELGNQLFRLRSSLAGFEDIVDIHALTRSLQSGVHELVSHSLDQLITISRDRVPLTLPECEDLLDSLLDCLEEQIEVLQPVAQLASESPEFTSFEILTKASKLELETLTGTVKFASPEYEREHAIDRIIAISTILRNLSFYDVNQSVLASPPVVALVCDLIRLLDMKASALLNARNAQDLMKDLVTFLSNTADKVELAAREDAQCVLHFLLAFAPLSTVLKLEPRTRTFSPYVPTLHQYLPCAVDTLAKILARDEPNRAFYRQIFQADSTSTEPYALLTRTFGLAISPIPDRTKGYMLGGAEVRISEVRKPFLSQGMLAADIIASLAPSNDGSLTRSWLESEDGWAPSLLSMIITLAMDRTSAAPQPRQSAHSYEGNGFASITHRAVAMLQKLVEKSDVGRSGGHDDSGAGGASPSRVFTVCMPVEETILTALMDPVFDQQVLRQVIAFSKLGQ